MFAIASEAASVSLLESPKERSVSRSLRPVQIARVRHVSERSPISTLIRTGLVTATARAVCSTHPATASLPCAITSSGTRYSTLVATAVAARLSPPTTMRCAFDVNCSVDGSVTSSPASTPTVVSSMSPSLTTNRIDCPCGASTPTSSVPGVTFERWA